MSIFFTAWAFIVLVCIARQMITVKTWKGEDIGSLYYSWILFLWSTVFIYGVIGPYTVEYLAEMDRQYEQQRQARIEAMQQSRKDYMNKYKYYYRESSNDKKMEIGDGTIK